MSLHLFSDDISLNYELPHVKDLINRPKPTVTEPSFFSPNFAAPFPIQLQVSNTEALCTPITKEPSFRFVATFCLEDPTVQKIQLSDEYLDIGPPAGSMHTQDTSKKTHHPKLIGDDIHTVVRRYTASDGSSIEFILVQPVSMDTVNELGEYETLYARILAEDPLAVLEREQDWIVMGGFIKHVLLSSVSGCSYSMRRADILSEKIIRIYDDDFDDLNDLQIAAMVEPPVEYRNRQPESIVTAWVPGAIKLMDQFPNDRRNYALLEVKEDICYVAEIGNLKDQARLPLPFAFTGTEMIEMAKYACTNWLDLGLVSLSDAAELPMCRESSVDLRYFDRLIFGGHLYERAGFQYTMDYYTPASPKAVDKYNEQFRKFREMTSLGDFVALDDLWVLYDDIVEAAKVLDVAMEQIPGLGHTLDHKLYYFRDILTKDRLEPDQREALCEVLSLLSNSADDVAKASFTDEDLDEYPESSNMLWIQGNSTSLVSEFHRPKISGPPDGAVIAAMLDLAVRIYESSIESIKRELISIVDEAESKLKVYEAFKTVVDKAKADLAAMLEAGVSPASLEYKQAEFELDQKRRALNSRHSTYNSTIQVHKQTEDKITRIEERIVRLRQKAADLRVQYQADSQSSPSIRRARAAEPELLDNISVSSSRPAQAGEVSRHHAEF